MSKRASASSSSSLTNEEYCSSSMGTSIEDLNDDSLLCVFENIPLSELFNVQRVSLRWKHLALITWRRTKAIEISNDATPKEVADVLRQCGFQIVKLSCCIKPSLAPILLKTINEQCKSLKDVSFLFLDQELSGVWLDSLSQELIKNLETAELEWKLDKGKDDTFFLNGHQMHQLLGARDFHAVELDYHNYSSEPSISRFLQKAVNLIRFRIHATWLKGTCLNSLSSTCKNLDVSGCRVLEEHLFLETVERLPELEELELNNPIGMLWFPFFERCPSNLRRLSIEHSHDAYDIGRITASSFEKLVSLDVRHCSLLDEHVAQIVRTSPLLERLDLTGCRELTYAGFSQLGGIQRLLSLTLNHTYITNNAFEFLAISCGSIREVSCIGCINLTDSGLISMMEKATSLKRFHVTFGFHLTDAFSESALRLYETRKGFELSILLEINFLHFDMSRQYAEKVSALCLQIDKVARKLAASSALQVRFGEEKSSETVWHDLDTALKLFVINF